MNEDITNDYSYDTASMQLWLYFGSPAQAGSYEVGAESHVAWSADTLTVLRDVGALLPRPDKSAWDIYAEQGYGKGTLIGRITFDAEAGGFYVRAVEEMCPKTRFLYCERYSEAMKAMLDGLPDGPGRSKNVNYERHVEHMLKACALDYTGHVPCSYAYADEDVAREMAVGVVRREVQKRSVVIPVTVVALAVAALVYGALRLALLPGVLGVVATIGVLFVLPVAATEGVLACIRKVREPGVAREVLAIKLPVGQRVGEHEAHFAWGKEWLRYQEEGLDLTRRRGDVASMEETEHYVLVWLLDGKPIPVCKHAL